MKRTLHLLVTSYRREIGSTLIGLSVVIMLGHLKNEPLLPNTLVVTSRPLAAGTVLQETDVKIIRVPKVVSWIGSLHSQTTAVGKKLARPMQSGQPLASSDFFGNSLLAGLPRNMQAVALPQSDVTNSMVASVGNRVDIYASPRAFGAHTTLVAHDVRVLVAASHGDSTVFAESRDAVPLTVAVTPNQAKAIAAYLGSAEFSIAILS